MTFTLTVINGCPFCDELMRVFPNMVKKYPKAQFAMKCDTQAKEDITYPILSIIHLGKRKLYEDQISGSLYEKDVVDFIERSITNAEKS